MKTYTIIWLEFHECLSQEEIDEIIKDNIRLGITTKVIGATDPDDKYWIEFECSKIFSANTPADAYRIAICELNIPTEIDTFSILNDVGIVVATEEGANSQVCPYCNTTYNIDDGHDCWEKRSGLC